MSMPNNMNRQRYTEALDLLGGKGGDGTLDDLLQKIARCLGDPMLFPDLVQDIVEDEHASEIRINLARVQIE